MPSGSVKTLSKPNLQQLGLSQSVLFVLATEQDGNVFGGQAGKK